VLAGAAAASATAKLAGWELRVIGMATSQTVEPYRVTPTS
jgi:hypothetical protein